MTAPEKLAVEIAHPDIPDGVELHRIAAETGVLDVNTRYAYVLWCRDFAGTSVVARSDGAVVGFVTGYRRPDAPHVLFVWQVAVAAAARGRGIAGRMLDALVARVPGITALETTVTDGNTASRALFAAFAARHGARLERTELFGTDVLGARHESEILHRISPIDRGMMQK
ncbi:diaminobutyrate acetyltransferase [Pseudonocardia thermophila]|uniref:diaminobutyrate acetyltransferase n=1 Tax=Pseudonocardia thermophila TaxID=1848 RepID=UPI001F2F99D6|nr:diaminobutyrate acetyltransferase [Pseudonocardia thermophila]